MAIFTWSLSKLDTCLLFLSRDALICISQILHDSAYEELQVTKTTYISYYPCFFYLLVYSSKKERMRPQVIDNEMIEELF
jgi:hypothetical protein